MNERRGTSLLAGIPRHQGREAHVAAEGAERDLRVDGAVSGADMQPPDVTAEPVDRATLDHLVAVQVPVARVLERTTQLDGHVVGGCHPLAQQLAERRCLARRGVAQRGDVADRPKRLAEPTRRVVVGQVLPAHLEGVVAPLEALLTQEVHDGLTAVAALGLGGLLVGRLVRVGAVGAVVVRLAGGRRLRRRRTIAGRHRRVGHGAEPEEEECQQHPTRAQPESEDPTTSAHRAPTWASAAAWLCPPCASASAPATSSCSSTT